MAAMVSLSDVFYPRNEGTTTDDEKAEVKIPVIYAILTALIVPILGTFFVMVVKYADKVLKLNSTDFSIGYWFLVSIILTIV